MPVFGIALKNDSKLLDYVNETNKRLKGNSYINNPFNGSIKLLNGFCVVDMEPIYPNFAFLGAFLLTTSLILTGISLWNTPGVVIILMGVFWSKGFFYFMFMKGLSRNGYKGKGKILKDKETIRRLINVPN